MDASVKTNGPATESIVELRVVLNSFSSTAILPPCLAGSNRRPVLSSCQTPSSPRRTTFEPLRYSMLTSYQKGSTGSSSTIPTSSPPIQRLETSRPSVSTIGSEGHWCSLIVYPPDMSPKSMRSWPRMPMRLNDVSCIGPLVSAWKPYCSGCFDRRNCLRLSVFALRLGRSGNADCAS